MPYAIDPKTALCTIPICFKSFDGKMLLSATELEEVINGLIGKGVRKFRIYLAKYENSFNLAADSKAVDAEAISAVQGWHASHAVLIAHLQKLLASKTIDYFEVVDYSEWRKRQVYQNAFQILNTTLINETKKFKTTEMLEKDTTDKITRYKRQQAPTTTPATDSKKDASKTVVIDATNEAGVRASIKEHFIFETAEYLSWILESAEKITPITQLSEARDIHSKTNKRAIVFHRAPLASSMTHAAQCLPLFGYSGDHYIWIKDPSKLALTAPDSKLSEAQTMHGVTSAKSRPQQNAAGSSLKNVSITIGNASLKVENASQDDLTTLAHQFFVAQQQTAAALQTYTAAAVMSSQPQTGIGIKPIFDAKIGSAVSNGKNTLSEPSHVPLDAKTAHITTAPTTNGAASTTRTTSRLALNRRPNNSPRLTNSGGSSASNHFRSFTAPIPPAPQRFSTTKKTYSDPLGNKKPKQQTAPKTLLGKLHTKAANAAATAAAIHPVVTNPANTAAAAAATPSGPSG